MDIDYQLPNCRWCSTVHFRDELARLQVDWALRVHLSTQYSRPNTVAYLPAIRQQQATNSVPNAIAHLTFIIRQKEASEFVCFSLAHAQNMMAMQWKLGLSYGSGIAGAKQWDVSGLRGWGRECGGARDAYCGKILKPCREIMSWRRNFHWKKALAERRLSFCSNVPSRNGIKRLHYLY